MQKTFICYNLEHLNILAFIRNDYSTIFDAAEVFKNFENYGIIETDIEPPEEYTKYKIILDENEVFIGFEKLTQEEIIEIDPKEDAYNAAMILLGGEE